MTWRKEERTEKQTSSLPAVCRADPVYSGDGLVRRFLALEISRREGILAVGRTRAEHTGGRRGVPHRKDTRTMIYLKKTILIRSGSSKNIPSKYKCTGKKEALTV